VLVPVGGGVLCRDEGGAAVKDRIVVESLPVLDVFRVRVEVFVTSEELAFEPEKDFEALVQRKIDQLLEERRGEEKADEQFPKMGEAEREALISELLDKKR